MKISTKGRYALRMLIDLAEHQNSGFIALRDIAERQRISKKYLEQIVPLLNQSEILRANRGSLGGYMLAQSPDKYTVGQVLRITEGGLCPVSCLVDEPNKCRENPLCQTLSVWRGLSEVIANYLDSITIQDILDSSKDLGANEYYI